jgi:TolA-binding protein
MSNSIKVALYVVLATLACVSGYFAFKSFGALMERAGDRHANLEQVEAEQTLVPAQVVEGQATNSAVATNLSEQPASTNSPEAAAAVAPQDTNSHTISETTNATEAAPSISSGTAKKRGGGRIGLWTALFILSIAALGLLLASDVSHYFGNRALKVLYNDEGVGLKDPEYEQAEQVWANGRHLEAIGLMREYLNKNPREQHVAIRIAEIYEKDLGNYLAAALEYEEVLKHKLTPDRWGWSAIHLCNLYFKLNQEEKAYTLLRRLVAEHPATAAAEKARKRLGQVEGTGGGEQIVTEEQVNAAPARSVNTAPTSNLPPGFRPKK